MAEKYVYTAPQPVGPTAAEVELVGIELRRHPEWLAHFTTRDDKGRYTEHYYRDTEAQPTLARDIVLGLNKANMSTKSMERRIMERLAADGKLAAGAITGAPD